MTCFNIILSLSVTGQDLIEFNFRVEGNCGMCQERIEKVAKSNGAETADWNIDNQVLTIAIDMDKVSVSTIRYAIAQAGHDNGAFFAPDEVYNDLHGCCKYRVADVSEDYLSIEEDHTDYVLADGEGYEGGQKERAHDHRGVEGYIMAYDNNGEKFPLIGATVSLRDKTGTTTDLDGYFYLENENHLPSITISYVGYETQSVEVGEGAIADIVMADGHQLETVEISYREKTTKISFLKPLNAEEITREELCKAACCNLSESFETNPAVDVSFNDAVTGTKQIEMLGLAGPYVQVTRELIPDVRTMNNIFGLNMTPGPWIESIQLIKGVGSVVNGYESIAGQINVELKKPDSPDEVLHVNAFANNGGRLEINSNFSQYVTPNVSTGVLIHAKRNQQVHDRNNDGFTDMPLENDMVFVNRWKFNRTKNIEGQIGFKAAILDHEGGSHDHFAGISEAHESHWRMYNDTKRFELWGKMGYIFPGNSAQSLGLQMSAVSHDMDAQFGNGLYIADQQSLYANLIYQNIFENDHIIRTGLSYQYDNIDETVSKAGIYSRSESVPGAYMEYNFKKDEKWAIIAGLRGDHHNNYGFFVTPRLHAKYNIADKSIVRFIAGRGLKTANIFAENMGLFASSRAFSLTTDAEDLGNPYGLKPEVAWNYGINLTQAIPMGEKEVILGVDLFHTAFQNQVIADYETTGRIDFYNLDGESYSNSFQIKADVELIPRLDVRIAYRYIDAKTDYKDGRKQRPLVSKHRAFINLAYATTSDWHFDATVNWRGTMRLPTTAGNPEEYRREDNSPSYFLAGGQVSKRWGKKYDVYVGVENLFDYKQENAIIAGDDAFGEFFDASIIWAPLFGRNLYVGFRYNLIK